MDGSSSAIDSRLATLRQTFSQGKTKPYEWRVSQLNALMTLCQEREKEICEALEIDLGKGHTEAYVSEVGFLIAEIKHALKHLKSWMKPRKVSTPLLAFPSESFQQPEPLGVVLILGAWNFPFQLTLAPLVSAITAGNCAILKPSELALETSALIAKLIPEYMDNEAFEVFEGGKEVSTELLEKAYDHIFYTGGELVGKIVMQAAAKHLTPVTLELGGKSPCIVDKDTDLTIAANRIAWGKWTNAGQICIAPDYVFVHEDIKEAFISALQKSITRFFGKDTQTSKDYARIVNERHFTRLVSYLDGTECEVIGGNHNIDTLYLEPTILVGPSDAECVMQEEIFGPILPLKTFSSHEQVSAYVNDRPKPLALYMFSKSKQTQQYYIENTSCGNMCINDTIIMISNSNLGFGGVGNSGMGRYHGKAGFDLLSNLKSVMRRPQALDVFVRYPPYNKLKHSLLKWLQ